MPYPYDYTYHRPTGKEQASLLIGALLSGGLGAASGENKSDAIRKGIAGAVSGYGSGFGNYQNLMGDAFTRDLQTKGYDQRVKEFEETEKPESAAKINWYNQRDMPDYNRIRDERVKRRLDIKAKRADLAKPEYAPGDKEREAFENVNNLKSLPPDQLALLRKDPEYIAALNAFIKPNIMAEPYTPNLGEPVKTPQKGLWDSIKDRFTGEPKQDTVSKGVEEALGDKSAMQDMPDPAQHTGKTLRDTVTNKRYISNGKNWNPIP